MILLWINVSVFQTESFSQRNGKLCPTDSQHGGYGMF